MSDNKQPNNMSNPISDEELARIRDESKIKGMRMTGMKPTPAYRRRKEAEYICSDYMDVYLACIRSGKRNCINEWHDFNKCVDSEMEYLKYPVKDIDDKRKDILEELQKVLDKDKKW